MATIAKIANGTLFKKGDGGGVNFTTIPEMKKIDGPTIKFDLLDVTSHDSTGFFREYIPGLADGEKISGDLNWRPSNTVHKALRVDSYARVLSDFQIVFPDTSDNTVTCFGYCQQIKPASNIGAILMANLDVKITGQPNWS